MDNLKIMAIKLINGFLIAIEIIKATKSGLIISIVIRGNNSQSNAIISQEQEWNKNFLRPKINSEKLQPAGPN